MSARTGHAYAAPEAHNYGQAVAAYRATTARGTFYVCHECHEAEHCGTDDGKNHWPISRADYCGPLKNYAPACSCDHVSHFAPPPAGGQL